MLTGTSRTLARRSLTRAGSTGEVIWVPAAMNECLSGLWNDQFNQTTPRSELEGGVSVSE